MTDINPRINLYELDLTQLMALRDHIYTTIENRLLSIKSQPIMQQVESNDLYVCCYDGLDFELPPGLTSRLITLPVKFNQNKTLIWDNFTLPREQFIFERWQRQLGLEAFQPSDVLPANFIADEYQDNIDLEIWYRREQHTDSGYGYGYNTHYHNGGQFIKHLKLGDTYHVFTSSSEITHDIIWLYNESLSGRSVDKTKYQAIPTAEIYELFMCYIPLSV